MFESLSWIIGWIASFAAGPAAPAPHHPHDIISAVAFAPDYPEDPRMFVASPGTINLFLVSADGGYTWKPTRSGIRGQVFREIVLASDWTESGVTYVITEDGGLQVSEDHGKTWGDPVCSKRLRFLAAPPVASDGVRAVFFATGSDLFASNDGGATNRHLFKPERGHIEAIAVSPEYEQDETLFVALSDAQLMISRDGGATWTATKAPAPVTHVELSPNYSTDRTIWVSTWGEGVCVSEDAGETFQRCSVGLSDLRVNEVRAARGTTSAELFCCTRDDGVFCSMDGGRGWTHTALRVNKTTQTDNHYTSLALSPSWPRDKTVLSGTFEGLNVSNDGGTTWRESNVNPPRIGRIVNTSPTFGEDAHVFACGYGMHLLVTEDAADSWDVRFTGMDAGSVYDIAPAPDFATSRLVMLGMYKGVRRSEDAGKTWQKVQFDAYDGEPRDGYTTRAITFMPGYPRDQRLFAIGTRGMFVRSDDLGKSWENQGVVTSWATTIAVSPDFDNDQTVFVGGAHVYRSEDGGATWVGPIFKGTFHADGLCVAADFAETGELYGIAKYRGFVVGSERGARWALRNEGLEGFQPSAMQLSPTFVEDNTIFLLTSGGGLFRSVDRGRSWQRVTAPGSPIDQGFSIALSSEFAKDQTMFVGSFDGFWRSRDGGVTWSPTTRMEVYDEKRDPWIRRGAWKRVWGGAPVNNTVTVSAVAGDEMEISFEGTGCRLIGPRGPECGIASIRLDGGEGVSFDQYAAERLDQQVMFEAEGLPNGSHTLVVRVTGTRSAASAGDVVAVDALEVVFR
ncbi:MAG: hypothetical protein VYA51_07875 [Planctomycetota bacterium]|nr:hypothetical protein [Planctomycetota bacterium]MEC9047916.1 hypothetical protein [Planctomycetota bacterium]